MSQIAGLDGAFARHARGAPPEHHASPIGHHWSPATRPIEVPHENAPPQEVFAALPEPAAASPRTQSPCDGELAKVATFRLLPPLIAPGECGAADAVLLESVLLPDRSPVAISPPATLRCTMAQAVVQWVREDVAPASAKLGAPLRALNDLGSYDCRGRDNVRGATLSEHGRANAIDVRSFKLANGRNLVLVDPTVAKDWREAVRAGACARFATVLGPGSDAEHAGHVHLDLAERRNNYKLCEWDVREPPAPAVAAAPSAAAVPLPEARPLDGSTTGEYVTRAARRLRRR